MSRYVKIILPPVILLITAVGFFLWRESTIGKLNDKIASINHEFQEKLTLLNNTPVMITQYASIDSDIKSYGDDLLGMDQAIDMVRKIGHSASNYNVALVDFKFDIAKYINAKRMVKIPGSYFIPFEVKFRGKYLDIGKFTKALERKKFIGNINYVQISHDPIENTEFYSIKGSVRFFEKYRKDS